MSRSTGRLVAWAFVLVGFGLFLAGCGGSEGEGDFGDWTMEEGSLRLTEDLRLSETANFYFGSVTALDVTPNGRMIVADEEAHNIKVLEPDGTLLDTLGREGQGPGEFRGFHSLQVARGDSVFVLDRQQSRLTVYGPDSPYRFARTVTISREDARIGQVYVLGGTLVGAQSTGIRQPEEGVLQPDPAHWVHLSETGVPGDTLFKTRWWPPYGLVKENGGISFDAVPFARQAHTAVGPDRRTYTGWPDSLHVTATDPTGETEVVVSISAPAIPVQEADIDSALSGTGAKLRGVIEPAIPATKPAFTDLLVAEDGRIWVKRPPEHPGADTVDWWVLGPETKTIRAVRLPREVELHVVRNGFAYGKTTTDVGAPAVVRYRIGEEG